MLCCIITVTALTAFSAHLSSALFWLHDFSSVDSWNPLLWCGPLWWLSSLWIINRELSRPRSMHAWSCFHFRIAPPKVAHIASQSCFVSLSVVCWMLVLESMELARCWDERTLETRAAYIMCASVSLCRDGLLARNQVLHELLSVSICQIGTQFSSLTVVLELALCPALSTDPDGAISLSFFEWFHDGRCDFCHSIFPY